MADLKNLKKTLAVEHSSSNSGKQKDESSKYGMSHRPSNMAPAHDLNSMAPDIYKHPEYYSTGEDHHDKQSMQVINSIHNKPDSHVMVHRSAPKGELNHGDWISLSKDYAKQEGSQEGTPVHSFKVKTSEIGWPGDSINEFGYFGKGIKKT